MYKRSVHLQGCFLFLLSYMISFTKKILQCPTTDPDGGMWIISMETSSQCCPVFVCFSRSVRSGLTRLQNNTHSLILPTIIAFSYGSNAKMLTQVIKVSMQEQFTPS